MSGGTLDRLERLHAQATPGPWRCEPNTHAGRVWVQRGRFRDDKDCEPLFNVRGAATYKRREADAALIADARNALPDLLAVARAAERVRAIPVLAGFVNDADPAWAELNRALAALDAGDDK